MAQQGLRRKEFKGELLLPKTVAFAALGEAMGDRTRKPYFDAFIEQKVLEELSPDQYVPNDVFPGRAMEVDGCPDGNIGYRLARLQSDSEITVRDEGSPVKIEEMAARKLPKSEWQDWATEFLLFASERWQWVARCKAAKGGHGKAQRRRESLGGRRG